MATRSDKQRFSALLDQRMLGVLLVAVFLLACGLMFGMWFIEVIFAVVAFLLVAILFAF